jgi:hypothetical protein
MAVVAADLHCSHVANGLIRKSLKRKHTSDLQPGDNLQSEIVRGSVLDEIAEEAIREVGKGEQNLSSCVSELITEAASDANSTADSSDNEDPAPSGSDIGMSGSVAPQIFLFLSPASKISLCTLFNLEISDNIAKA